MNDSFIVLARALC